VYTCIIYIVYNSIVHARPPSRWDAGGRGGLVAAQSGGAGTGKEEAQARKRQVRVYMMSIVYSDIVHAVPPALRCRGGGR